MEFTKYIWELYKSSDEGAREIAFFKKNDVEALSRRFQFDTSVTYLEENNIQSIYYPYEDLCELVSSYKINSFIEAEKLIDEIIIEHDEAKSIDNEIFLFDFLGAFSTALSHTFPSFFIPFYFGVDSFVSFKRFCKNFEIPFPQYPTRKSITDRIWFYYKICKTLHSFREKNKIQTEEFPAFIYSFGMKILTQIEEEELPKPSKVYFLGAGAGFNSEKNNPDFEFLDNAKKESINTWGAGGLNIQKGDIVLMYCVSPRKYIHSVWRAIDDSFIDPFSYYYYGVTVGFPIMVPPVTFGDLAKNEILKKNSTVKCHMQGMNGRSISLEEYNEILNIIAEKGQRINDLPKLPFFERKVENINYEKDVEEFLIEPLLVDLGFKSKDWVRQLPIKMGRSVKYYPDYAIGVTGVKGKEKAKIVLEAKYSISNEKQLSEAFLQARSYALRLQASCILLADIEYVWLFNRNANDFNEKYSLKFHWNDLNNSDNVYLLKSKLKK